MRHGPQGIKILGLSLLAAISVMAVSAAAAQAAHFAIEGTPLAAGDSETVAGTGVEGELLVPGIGLNINCTSSAFTGTLLPAGAADASVLFSGCTVLGNKFCKIYENEANMNAKTNAGNILATGTGELHLHEGQHYLIVKGVGAEEIFTTVYFNTAAEGCNLGGLSMVIKGLTALVLPTGLTNLVNQTIAPLTAADDLLLNGSAAGQLNLKLIFKFGNEPARLDGGEITNAHLTGKRVGQKWQAL